MPAKEFLHEAQQLKDVCQRLELLAEKHSHVGEAVLTIWGTILSTATILEVLVATKLAGPPRPM